jgi:hypothetical protein
LDSVQGESTYRYHSFAPPFRSFDRSSRNPKTHITEVVLFDLSEGFMLVLEVIFGVSVMLFGSLQRFKRDFPRVILAHEIDEVVLRPPHMGIC